MSIQIQPSLSTTWGKPRKLTVMRELTGTPVSLRTVSSVPREPHAAYAALIFVTYVERPGHMISAWRSRGNDSSEIVSFFGLARISISVSERDGVPFASFER